MAFVRYHKYIGELWQDLDLEDLVDELSDFFLQSGFGQDVDEWDEDSLQSLHDAILDAVLRRGLLSEEDLQKLMTEQETLDQFLQKVVERLLREGYLRSSEAQPFHDPTGGGCEVAGDGELGEGQLDGGGSTASPGARRRTVASGDQNAGDDPADSEQIHRSDPQDDEHGRAALDRGRSGWRGHRASRHSSGP